MATKPTSLAEYRLKREGYETGEFVFREIDPSTAAQPLTGWDLKVVERYLCPGVVLDISGGRVRLVPAAMKALGAK
jgi:hypothetical protein